LTLEEEGSGESDVFPSCPGPTNGSETLELGLYLDGILPEAHSRLVEVHLVACEACRVRLRQLREVKAALEDRALWKRRGKIPAASDSGTGDSGLGPVSTCLTAAEILLALEGKASSHAEKHLASCSSCTQDVVAIEDSSEEQVKGKIARPDLELLQVLKGAELEPVSESHSSSQSDALAPIIVIPISEAARAGKRISRRIAPRAPSKRVTAANARSAKKRRNVTVASGLFTFAAAAAAAVVVGLLVSQSGPVETPGTNHETAKAPPAFREAPVPAKKAPSQPATAGARPSEQPVADTAVDAPEPESPFTNEPGPVADVPGPQAETPTPAPTGDAPTVARGEKPEPKKVTPPAAPPIAPIVDDGARIDLDLSRLAGALAVSHDSGKWASVGRKDGVLSLKPGDRLRSTQGAFLSLETGTYELSLAPKSELVIRGLAQGPTVGLTQGRVLCEVEKLPQEKHLVVATASADFECTGTVFSVSADAQKAICEVSEGTVLCRGPSSGAVSPAPWSGEAHAIAAGFSVAVLRGQAPGEPKPFVAHDTWARTVRPEREILLSADFERDDASGFVGKTTDQGAFRGVGRSLVFETLPNDKYWGLTARAPKGKVKQFRPGPDVRIQFSVWLEKESRIELRLLNDVQGKYFKHDFGYQPANKWVTLTTPSMDITAYFDPEKSPIRESDVISEVSILAGQPNDTWRALLDDVQVYRKHYR
jgi:hypothetical protein